MKYRKVLSRRTLLRGAGTIAVALPFLSEMRTSSVFAAEPEPPARVLTMFFGLGVPSAFQTDAYARPFSEHLEPLGAVADKIAMLRGVYFDPESRTTGNHDRGSSTVFIGGDRTGASIDQVALQRLHGDSAPTAVRSLVAGTYSRQNANRRHIHSWVGPDMPTAQPIESPRILFEQAFGSMPVPGSELDPEAVRRARYERSILDSALSQYQHVTSDAFGLSESSRARVRLHLERVRELERRIYDPEAEPMMSPAMCGPAAPVDFDHPELIEIQKTINNEGVVMDVNRWMGLWHSMVDVMALAVKCDVTRFGNLQFQSGGERIRLYGDYTAYGQTRTFDDPETTHEYWHGWAPGNDDERRMRDHMWLLMAAVTDYLRALDDPEYTDENGLTVLDNALVLVSTELGDGRAHDIRDVFHLVSGANERIATGVHDIDAHAAEVYNAGLRAIGIDDRFMSSDDGQATGVASILA